MKKKAIKREKAIKWFIALILFYAIGVTIIGVILLNLGENDIIGVARKFTIEGSYDISEIRVNINVADHPTIQAQNDLLTLGFTNLDEPIIVNTDFLARYTHAETGEVVEILGRDMDRYIVSDDLDELLAVVEEYRLNHIGQTMIFDRYGNIRLNGTNNQVLYAGAYVWGGHTISVVILDLNTPGPRHESRNFLFFPNNEEFMQGSSCRRIIVREKMAIRAHGSIELMFGARCPDSNQPILEEDCVEVC